MNAETGKLLKPSEARYPAITTQESSRRTMVPPPGWATEESYSYMDSEDVDPMRFISAEYQDGEFKRLWSRTWQFACREDHIPEVGDYYVYVIGTSNFIVTRVAGNHIRAYFNACLYRGTKLRASGTEGNAREFKCSSHGWSRNIDGTTKDVLCPWDFPHVNKLPEARVETLSGFVWINMDSEAPTLREYLGPKFLKHIEAWKLENRYIAFHVCKPIPSNWKLDMEAFMEAYHVLDTHPQDRLGGIVSPSRGLR